LAGMWGQALEVGRNVGASFRSWPECRGAGFKRGPESWRDKLSKLTIKQSFFGSILQIQFFFEIFTPQKGGVKNIVPPHFSNMEHVQPRLIYDNRLPYVCLRVNLIYLLTIIILINLISFTNLWSDIRVKFIIKSKIHPNYKYNQDSLIKVVS
jgi:hypothetical protein